MSSKPALMAMFGLSLTVLLATAGSALAEGTQEGTIVSVKADAKDDLRQIVMTDQAGKKEMTFTVAASAKVTIDEKDAELKDLRKGDSVKVTLDESDKVTAVAVKRGKSLRTNSSNTR